MADSGTLTVRLSKDTKGRLAGRTQPTRDFLAAEAISAYAARELAIVDGIERGRADVRAGRVTPHDEAAREARTMVRGKRV